jgi:hypothetical protein
MSNVWYYGLIFNLPTLNKSIWIRRSVIEISKNHDDGGGGDDDDAA